MIACTEPGCTGTYEDGYCNVCGSPQAAGAGPAAPPSATSLHHGRERPSQAWPGRIAPSRR